MKIILIACAAAALATAACTHSTEQNAAVARIDGEQHVVVRAEAGRIWWQHRAWTEPHELWSLPMEGRVENLSIERSGDGYVVSFEQGGQSWSGSFGESPIAQRKATQLARREP